MSSRPRGSTRSCALSVNDPFVMGAWGQDQNVGDSVVMLSDGNGEFTAPWAFPWTGAASDLAPAE